MNIVKPLLGVAFIGLATLVAFPQTFTMKSPEATALAIPNQRTYNVSKTTCPNSSCAVLKAEKANPGWKVVNVKELSKVWHLTLKKP